MNSGIMDRLYMLWGRECLHSRVYFVVVYCTNPPWIVPGECTTTLLSFNALEKFAYKEKISYACEAGRKFTDGTKKRDVICTGDGTWNFNEVDCDCKLSFLSGIVFGFFYKNSCRIYVVLCAVYM